MRLHGPDSKFADVDLVVFTLLSRELHSSVSQLRGEHSDHGSARAVLVQVCGQRPRGFGPEGRLEEAVGHTAS